MLDITVKELDLYLSYLKPIAIKYCKDKNLDINEIKHFTFERIVIVCDKIEYDRIIKHELID